MHETTDRQTDQTAKWQTEKRQIFRPKATNVAARVCLLEIKVAAMMENDKDKQWVCHNNWCNIGVLSITSPCYVIVKLPPYLYLG